MDKITQLIVELLNELVSEEGTPCGKDFDASEDSDCAKCERCKACIRGYAQKFLLKELNDHYKKVSDGV